MKNWVRMTCSAVIALCLGVATMQAGQPKPLPKKVDDKAAPKVIPDDVDGTIVTETPMDSIPFCPPAMMAPLWTPPPMMGDMFFGGLLAQDNFGNSLRLSEPGGFSRYARISQNGYVIPTDRAFFNYNYLNGVMNGADVHYFNSGFEKTFFGGRASVQLNIPFASTLDNVQSAFGPANATEFEFGNINVWLKVLLARTENFALSAGLGVNTPTADDIELFAIPGAGPSLLRAENDSVLLNPFVGAAWTPNQRLFAQTFAQLDIDTNGYSVFANNAFVGRLHSSTLLSIGAGFGYALFQDQSGAGLISSITPMVEFHYTTDLGSSERFVGPGGSVTSLSNEIDTANVLGGVNVGLGDRANFNVGAGVPLFGNDRQWNWQVLCQLNIVFGGP